MLVAVLPSNFDLSKKGLKGAFISWRGSGRATGIGRELVFFGRLGPDCRAFSPFEQLTLLFGRRLGH